MLLTYEARVANSGLPPILSFTWLSVEEHHSVVDQKERLRRELDDWAGSRFQKMKRLRRLRCQKRYTLFRSQSQSKGNPLLHRSKQMRPHRLKISHVEGSVLVLIGLKESA